MSDGNSQPTPEQDAANGTVSAANVTTIGEAPSVAAATPEFKLAAEQHFDAVREADGIAAAGQDEAAGWQDSVDASRRATEADEAYDKFRALVDNGSPAELAEAMTNVTEGRMEFVATSDEDAPNIGHVTYTEDEAPASDTPVFDSTPGADDVSHDV